MTQNQTIAMPSGRPVSGWLGGTTWRRATLIGLIAFGAALVARDPVQRFVFERSEVGQAYAQTLKALANANSQYAQALASATVERDRRAEQARLAALAEKARQRAAMGLPPELEGRDRQAAEFGAGMAATKPTLERIMGPHLREAMERARIYQEAAGGKDPNTIAPSFYRPPSSGSAQR